MKNPFLIFGMTCLFAGCGSSGIQTPTLATQQQPQNSLGAPVQPSPSPTIPERILASVEFHVGSYSYVATRWLESKGMNYVPQDRNPISTDIDLASSIRVNFSIPSVMTTPDAALVMAKYGCSDPHRGDVYYYDGTLSDAKITLNQGSPVYSVTVTGLDNVFHWCNGRPVALEFKLVDRSRANVVGNVVLYFQSETVGGADRGGGQ